ncbi:hypothetical protein GCM10025857_14850 [Alicyclobacillus contaminans]|uniref:hypothetical protein n=1 Tax=Alicyclobacillus contaminans TaxID=392016 RepID=UPI00047A3F25|nr:hypothetical protein [Alicyclobacillus contaminans]GMA50128.1 hypothetical protein GCM10025857_14850 [Alicyclobacillus contaminans]
MALIIPNVGNAVLLDPVTGAIKAPFTKMDSIKLDIDGKLTPVNAGPGMYPIVNISADRAPKVTLQGSELPLAAASALTGANVTVAASGSAVQQAMVDYLTVAADGTLTLTSPISEIVTTVSIMSVSDGKLFQGVASSPTAGQYQNPSGGESTLTCSTADAGKSVVVSYTTDITTGGKIDVLTTSIPGSYKLVAQGKVVNSEDPSKKFVPITFVVNSCQMIGTWSMSMERQKASSNSVELNVLDPGGNLPAISIITQAKFAG